VCDPAGRTIVFKKQDHCPAGPAAYAAVKASTCVAMNCSSRSLKDRYLDRPGQLTSMIVTTPGGLAPFPGGVLLMSQKETPPRVVGAVGVSGASADKDEHCAVVAAHAIGFLTDPPHSALME